MNKLHTITDEDAIAVGRILLKSATSNIYDFEFIQIKRRHYDFREGTDAEETVNVYFYARIKDERYADDEWKNKQIIIKLIDHDRYHDYPHFVAFYNDGMKFHENHHMTNHVEAVIFLKEKGYL